MATTAQQVFDRSMALMDAVDESGSTINDDTLEYQNRALALINLLLGELYFCSDNCALTAGARPVCTEAAHYSDTLHIDDFLARTILPYGLAYHLLISEDPSVAGVYLQRYQELLAKYGGAVPRTSEDIRDVYGGVGNGRDE